MIEKTMSEKTGKRADHNGSRAHYKRAPGPKHFYLSRDGRIG